MAARVSNPRIPEIIVSVAIDELASSPTPLSPCRFWFSRCRSVLSTDGELENDVEAELAARIIDGIKQAKKHNDESKRIGEEIMTLEEEIKTVGHSTPAQHSRLDDLYRSQMRHAEAEKKALDDQDIINNIAILQNATGFR